MRLELCLVDLEMGDSVATGSLCSQTAQRFASRANLTKIFAEMPLKNFRLHSHDRS